MTAPTMDKLRLGNNDDGTPLFHFQPQDPTNAHVVITGPYVTGAFTTSDQTIYDCTDPVVAVDSLVHAVELANAIGQYFEDNGHPQHDDQVPFTFIPLDVPGQATAALASTAAENAALNGLDGTGSTNTIPFVSLHTATPGTTGASENANTGSYARQSCTWNAAASGAKTNSTALTFSTAGSVAVTYIGTWSSGTYGAGNYAIGGALGSSVTAASITIASGAISLSAS